MTPTPLALRQVLLRLNSHVLIPRRSTRLSYSQERRHVSYTPGAATPLSEQLNFNCSSHHGKTVQSYLRGCSGFGDSIIQGDFPTPSPCLSLPPPLSRPSAASLHSWYTTAAAGHHPGAQLPHRKLPTDLSRQQAPLNQWHGVSRATGSGKSGSAALQYDALLVDVGGTLLETHEPVPRVYAQFGEKHGVVVSEDKIKAGFREAFSKPWPKRLRYEGSGEDFWRYAVATALGCENEALFQDLYRHFSSGDAWRVADGAEVALQQLRDAGVKLAVVSNFDTRLRPILRDLQVESLFDSIIVSCEVLHEKPAPEIFQAALDELSLRDASRVVHLGDDALNDFEGAQRMGMEAWLWKRDVSSFKQVAEKMLGRVNAEP